jgi:hypothetical protein
MLWLHARIPSVLLFKACFVIFLLPVVLYVSWLCLLNQKRDERLAHAHVEILCAYTVYSVPPTHTLA